MYWWMWIVLVFFLLCSFSISRFNIFCILLWRSLPHFSKYLFHYKVCNWCCVFVAIILGWRFSQKLQCTYCIQSVTFATTKQRKNIFCYDKKSLSIIVENVFFSHEFSVRHHRYNLSMNFTQFLFLNKIGISNNLACVIKWKKDWISKRHEKFSAICKKWLKILLL